MKPPLAVYWSRRDFRLADNPALLLAAECSRTTDAYFLPLFILEDYMIKGEPKHQFGYPSRIFLSKAIPVFAKNFKEFAVLQGKVVQVLSLLAKEYEITVFVNDDVYPDFYIQVEKLKALGINVEVSEDALTIDKATTTKEGNIYSVFTPFKNAVWGDFIAQKALNSFTEEGVNYLSSKEILSLPCRLENSSTSLGSVFSSARLLLVGDEILDLADYVERPNLEGWYVSEDEALKKFSEYLKDESLHSYAANRDSLELDVYQGSKKGVAYSGKTSKMSLALAWGLVSPRILMAEIKKHFKEQFDNPLSGRVSQGALTYINELIWREFYRYQLFHRPELLHTEFQKKYQNNIKWAPETLAKERFLAWIQGQTGYGVVDAAMKQLARTGWMHNRSRMIVSSVLTKNLGVDWRWGQEYFRAVLVDLDEASNCGGWQWGASVGTDPKPIRIFNPELQAKRFDASGAYQKKWQEESSGFKLQSPALPILEQKTARAEALERYGLKNDLTNKK